MRLTLQGMAKTAMWPTPAAEDAKHSGRMTDSGAQTHLPEAVNMAMWPTPKGSPEHYGQPRDNDRGDLQAAALDNFQDQVGGQLNPDWVEWLMGIPIGWTSPEPLKDAVFLSWETEPDIPRVASGVPHRVDRLKLCGNGIVPECVAKFLRMLGG